MGKNVVVTFNNSALAGLVENVSKITMKKLKDETVRVAKVLCPVDTGYLRESIEATVDGVEATADYALFVELGTRKTPPQPFLTPAVDIAIDRINNG